MRRKILFCLLLIFVLTNQVFAQEQDNAVFQQKVQFNWPTFGGDFARTGHKKGTGIKQKPAVKWTYSTSSRGTSVISALVMSDGRVFFTSGGKLYAVSARKGNVLWTRHNVNQVNIHDITVKQGGVYVYGNAGDLLALDARTGKKKWQYHGPRTLGGFPVVKSDYVFAVYRYGSIYALLPGSGKQRWKAGFQHQNRIERFLPTQGVSVADGKLYLPRSDVNDNHENLPDLYTFSIRNGPSDTSSTRNGNLIWSKTMEGSAVAPPAVKDQIAYFPINGLWALSSRDGTTKWTFPVKGQDHINHDDPPAIADGVVYFSTDKGGVYAVDAEDGSLIWKRKFGFGKTTSPRVVGDVIYIGGQRYIHALSVKDGKEHWKFETDASVTAIAPVGKMVYVGTSYKSGRVYALIGK